ncbi:unnamed protein product [Paramecium octaurelia]|uniref:Uncharacterized protein n=1 Tax=Paramecium octaurelia TaxID=43137 RepID=A0A8S1UIS5_PAROT|nr:unnamed protein product [Paramecium octaurelia]
MSKDPHDTFKGVSENFFFNLAYSNHLNLDERPMIIQNIKEDVTKDQIIEFYHNLEELLVQQSDKLKIQDFNLNYASSIIKQWKIQKELVTTL